MNATATLTAPHDGADGPRRTRRGTVQAARPQSKRRVIPSVTLVKVANA